MQAIQALHKKTSSEQRAAGEETRMLTECELAETLREREIAEMPLPLRRRESSGYTRLAWASLLLVCGLAILTVGVRHLVGTARRPSEWVGAAGVAMKLNRIFVNGRPTSNLMAAGVVVRQFINLDAWIAPDADQTQPVSVSLINAHLPYIFSSTAAGFVLSTSALSEESVAILCAFAIDGATDQLHVAGESITGPCADTRIVPQFWENVTGKTYYCSSLEASRRGNESCPPDRIVYAADQLGEMMLAHVARLEWLASAAASSEEDGGGENQAHVSDSEACRWTRHVTPPLTPATRNYCRYNELLLSARRYAAVFPRLVEAVFYPTNCEAPPERNTSTINEGSKAVAVELRSQLRRNFQLSPTQTPPLLSYDCGEARAGRPPFQAGNNEVAMPFSGSAPLSFTPPQQSPEQPSPAAPLTAPPTMPPPLPTPSPPLPKPSPPYPVASFIAIGDWGKEKGLYPYQHVWTTDGCQEKIAGLINREIEARAQTSAPVKFVISLGDHFYPGSFAHENHTDFARKWGDVYAGGNGSDIVWYGTHGNHDFNVREMWCLCPGDEADRNHDSEAQHDLLFDPVSGRYVVYGDQLPFGVDGGLNLLERDSARVGEWGGTCTCPDGQQYAVGDVLDSGHRGCTLLACIGGAASAACKQRGSDEVGAHMKATCAAPVLTTAKPKGEPVLLAKHSSDCAQIRAHGKVLKGKRWYLPAFSYSVKPLPGIDLELVMLDANYVDWEKVCVWQVCLSGMWVCDEGDPECCSKNRPARAPCSSIAECRQALLKRGREANVLLQERIRANVGKNLLVGSHYPLWYLHNDPLIHNISTDVADIHYFGAHVHSSFEDPPWPNQRPRRSFTLGGGGGWTCDKQGGGLQGFAIGEILSNGTAANIRVVNVPLEECCWGSGYPDENEHLPLSQLVAAG